MIIKSADNKNFKYIKKLRTKKFRDMEDKFIIETKKMVDEATGYASIDFIFVNEDNKDFRTNHKKIVFSNDLYNKLSSLENSDGVSAIVYKKKKTEFKSKNILLLDKISDPGNMGTLIRSAEAFGFVDILYINGSVDIYNEKTLRATMGSIFRLNIKKIDYNDINLFKGSRKIISADLSGLDIDDYKNDTGIILAIGNESNGLSDEIRNMTDIFVKIPMQGNVESLNAAIAGSILMNKLSY